MSEGTSRWLWGPQTLSNTALKSKGRPGASPPLLSHPQGAGSSVRGNQGFQDGDGDPSGKEWRQRALSTHPSTVAPPAAHGEIKARCRGIPSLLFSFCLQGMPKEAGPHRGSGGQSKTEGEEGVVPAAPGESSQSPGFALSVPSPCIPARHVLPARWLSSMVSYSKLNPVDKETTCQSSQMSQRLRESGTGRPVTMCPAPNQRLLQAAASSAPWHSGGPLPQPPIAPGTGPTP